MVETSLSPVWPRPSNNGPSKGWRHPPPHRKAFLKTRTNSLVAWCIPFLSQQPTQGSLLVGMSASHFRHGSGLHADQGWFPPGSGDKAGLVWGEWQSFPHEWKLGWGRHGLKEAWGLQSQDASCLWAVSSLLFKWEAWHEVLAHLTLIAVLQGPSS